MPDDVPFLGNWQTGYQSFQSIVQKYIESKNNKIEDRTNYCISSSSLYASKVSKKKEIEYIWRQSYQWITERLTMKSHPAL